MTEMLQHWVTAQAGRRADATAVVFQDERLSYGELEVLSNQLARALKERGCVRGDRIALLVPKSPLAAVCQIGIYKADCIYVPLDSSSTTKRLAGILAHSGSRCLIASASLAPRVRELFEQPSLPSLRVGWLGTPADPEGLPVSFRFSDIGVLPGIPLRSAYRAQDPAQILYDPRDTALLQGVVLNHASGVEAAEWVRRRFRLEESDRLAGDAPLPSHHALVDLFGSAAAGAELHLVPEECHHLPRRLAAWIRDSGVTQWSSSSESLDNLARLDAVQPWDFPQLRRVHWHGSLSSGALDHWMKRLPHVAFTGLHGPAETGIASHHTAETYLEGEVEFPIGTAAGSAELLVLDHNLQPVITDAAGDLYVKGPGLSAGYWNDPEATSHAFPTLEGFGRVYRSGSQARRGQDGLIYPVTDAISRAHTSDDRFEEPATVLAFEEASEKVVRLPQGQWSAWQELPGQGEERPR
jgi:non-ribosomal peptide synthetase component F